MCTPPNSAQKTATQGQHEPLVERFDKYLEMVCNGPLLERERQEAAEKARKMFREALRVAEEAARNTTAPRPNEAGLAHQVHEAARAVFSETPGVTVHHLAHGDAALWVGAFAATIVELRAANQSLQEMLDRFLPPPPPLQLVDDSGRVHTPSRVREGL